MASLHLIYPSTTPTTLQKWIELIYSQKVSFHLTNPPPKKKQHASPEDFEERLPSAGAGAVLVAEMGPMQMPGRPVVPGAKRKDGGTEFTTSNGDLLQDGYALYNYPGKKDEYMDLDHSQRERSDVAWTHDLFMVKVLIFVFVDGYQHSKSNRSTAHELESISNLPPNNYNPWL